MYRQVPALIAISALMLLSACCCTYGRRGSGFSKPERRRRDTGWVAAFWFSQTEQHGHFRMVSSLRADDSLRSMRPQRRRARERGALPVAQPGHAGDIHARVRPFRPQDLQARAGRDIPHPNRSIPVAARQDGRRGTKGER